MANIVTSCLFVVNHTNRGFNRPGGFPLLSSNQNVTWEHMHKHTHVLQLNPQTIPPRWLQGNAQKGNLTTVQQKIRFVNWIPLWERRLHSWYERYTVFRLVKSEDLMYSLCIIRFSQSRQSGVLSEWSFLTELIDSDRCSRRHWTGLYLLYRDYNKTFTQSTDIYNNCNRGFIHVLTIYPG